MQFCIFLSCVEYGPEYFFEIQLNEFTIWENISEKTLVKYDDLTHYPLI